MFNNIGGKIKGVARFNCWMGIIASVIGGIIFMRIGKVDGLEIVIAFLIIVFGSLISWVSSFLLYGFGEMVENSDIRTEIAVRKKRE